MAGIGFSLKKIIKYDSLSSIVAAYTTAGVISSAPWIISILSILILGAFLSITPVYHESVMQFQISITYLVAGSLIVSGFAQNSFSRYVADQLFLNRSEYIIPNFHGMILLVTALSGCLSFFLILFFFPEQSIAYRFLFMGSFVTLSNAWVVINLLTGLRDYTIIVKAFILSYGLIVCLGYLLRDIGIDGLMMGYFVGQLILIITLISTLYEAYPTKNLIDFHFLKKNKVYKILMLSGLFFNMAIWVDKFVFWYCPSTSHYVIGPLRGSFFYDVPIYIAYLTVVPGMGVLLFLVETSFADYYERFHEAIRNGKSLSYIQIMREQMVNHAHNVIYSIVKMQAFTILLVFLMGERILSLFNISPIYKNLLFVDVIGTSLQVVCLGILNLLYYVDRRNEAFRLTVMFFTLNLIFSIWSIYMGPFYYGYGFTISLVVTCTFGMSLLDKAFSNMEYEIIVLRD